MKKKLFCLILSLLMVLSLLPGFAGAETDPEETEAPSEPAAAVSESPVVRGVHNTIIIDDDPTDGYEGDYVVIYNPSTTASNSLHRQPDRSDRNDCRAEHRSESGYA